MESSKAPLTADKVRELFIYEPISGAFVRKNSGRLIESRSVDIEGKKVNLGRFAAEEEAGEAYKKAAKEHHKEFACLD